MTRLLTIEQVASILVKAEKTVYNYLESGMLDCGFKIGHEWRVTEEDLVELDKEAEDSKWRGTSGEITAIITSIGMRARPETVGQRSA